MPLNGTVEWVIIAYLVVTAATLLTIGRLADMVGRKPIWIAGTRLSSPRDRPSAAPRHTGISGGGSRIPGAGGSTSHGDQSGYADQRLPGFGAWPRPRPERGHRLSGRQYRAHSRRCFDRQFYLALDLLRQCADLGVIGFIATVLLLHEPEQRGVLRLDPAGAVLLALGLASLTAGLSFGQEWGWSSPLLISRMAHAALSLVAMVAGGAQVRIPVVDMRLLRNRVFASANISLILSFLALFAVGFMLPFYLEELRGFQAEEAGLLLTPLPLTIAVIAPFSGTLADRIGTRWLASTGLAIACIGLLLISQLNAETSLLDMIWRLVADWYRTGSVSVAEQQRPHGRRSPGQQGSAAGFLATGRVVGQSISVALAGAIFASSGRSCRRSYPEWLA